MSLLNKISNWKIDKNEDFYIPVMNPKGFYCFFY
jgi:hypothetical protein